MENFNFEQMQVALNNVNAATQTVGGAAALLVSAQQSFHGQVALLAQAYQGAQEQIAEQAAKIAELEAIVGAQAQHEQAQEADNG